ncbi:MAG TPA: hypothetical protein VNI20_00165 [Fimbriimonadaceae bacterium]|nr:hypothetical protein [Fimbriimonadaceae bacterium]
MRSVEAKHFVDKSVDLEYRDRVGNIYLVQAYIYDVGFLPMHGPCLIADIGEVRLDRVLTISEVQGTERLAG